VRSFRRNRRKHYGTDTSRLRHVLLPGRRFARQICREGTHAIRALIQRSQATNAALSRELGINVKTVAKWRKRETVEDRRTGPTLPSSTVLSAGEEAMVVAFRRHTLLPLDGFVAQLGLKTCSPFPQTDSSNGVCLGDAKRGESVEHRSTNL